MMIAGFYRVMVVPQVDCAHSRGEQSVGMYRVEKQREFLIPLYHKKIFRRMNQVRRPDQSVLILPQLPYVFF